MLKVAANQDRAEKIRKDYVYQQHIRVVTRRTNGKLARKKLRTIWLPRHRMALRRN